MRLAFESTCLLGNPTGVGVFARSLLDELLVRPDTEVVAFAVTWRGRGALRARVPRGATVVTRPLPARPAHALWKRMNVPRIETWTGAVDVVHGPNYVVPPARAGQVVTVHDLTSIRYPELCTRDTLAFPTLVQRAIDRGAYVHAVSEFVAGEVRDHFDVAADRVVAIPHGVPHLPKVDGGRGRLMAGSDRYVLAVGTVEPRKDYPRLVDAFDTIAAERPDLRLVIVGPDGWGVDEYEAAVARATNADRIVRTGWISDRDRAALLRGAAALVHPARYEGFGLPPLEALHAGIPVLATAAGAIPEVVGDSALLVAPADTEALADGLVRVLDDATLRSDLIERGRARAERFTWKRCADGLHALYQRSTS
jgi:glycosyltransferase involved in cell wall biosynthesis